MYKKLTGYSTSSNVSPERYIETIDAISDIANSALLYKIDQEDNRQLYRITKYEKRIDLIAKDIYNDEKYSWLLLYMNRISINELVRGKILSYIPIKVLMGILTEF